MTETSKSKARPKGKKPPRKMSRQRLKNIAVFYLQRYSSTAANLKRVLLRRIDTAIRAHGEAAGGDRKEMAGWADEVVTALVAAGALNDARYAEGRAAALRGLGRSATKIRAKLAAKGVGHTDITRALAETAVTADGEDADVAAARDYAARRRLGPWRGEEETPESRKKDMAALARAGFPYAVAKKVMDEGR